MEMKENNAAGQGRILFRKVLALCIVTVEFTLLMSSIIKAFSDQYYLAIPGSVIGFMLITGSLVALWHGHKWAKWVLIILFILRSLACMFIPLFQIDSMRWFPLVGLIGISVFYGAVAVFMVISKRLDAYFASLVGTRTQQG